MQGLDMDPNIFLYYEKTKNNIETYKILQHKVTYLTIQISKIIWENINQTFLLKVMSYHLYMNRKIIILSSLLISNKLKDVQFNYLS